MREIKFRCWDKLGKKMMMDIHECYDWEMMPFKTAEDDSSVLMQFTGLPDKNGVDVFEGDIVEIYSKVGKTKTIGEVVYESKVSAFMVDDTTFKQYLPLTQEDCIEVVGNIYENKELLNEI